MSLRDFGLRSDPGDQGYARDDGELRSIPTSSIADQFVYQSGQALRDVENLIARVSYSISRADAFGATDEQREGLKSAARDCERALANAIAQLCREPGYGQDNSDEGRAA